MMYKYFLTILLFLTGSLVAETNGDGGYAGSFLRMGIGARALSMGDSHTAIAEDAVSGIYNPALVPFLDSGQLSVASAFLTLDRSLNYIGYAQPLSPKFEDNERPPLRAGLSLAWIGAGVDNIDGRDFRGEHTTNYSHSEHAFYLSFALRPLDKLAIGISGKVLYSRFPGMDREENTVSSKGFGIDFGAYFTPFADLSFAAVILDNMSKYTWNTDKVWERGTSTTYYFPKIYRAAIAYRFPIKWMFATAEIEDSKEQNPRYHWGTEFLIDTYGAFRLGMDHDLPTFGFGLNFVVWEHPLFLNYAFITPGDKPGPDHIFGWTFHL